MERHPLHRRNFLLHLQARPGYEQPVLLKEPARESLTVSHLNQLHNEYAITRRLADVPGVRSAYAKEGTESHPVLLLEYIQGQTVTELIQTASLDIPEKLRIAVDMAKILGGIHDRQVMHKDISSSNILVADDSPPERGVAPGEADVPNKPGVPNEFGGVYIIDFGIATTMRQERPGRASTDHALAGSLAYISPEQTGRMNRAVDYRTDMYSLGVTLYELFTGELPFQTGDSLEMIHGHIARQPTPPHIVDADIPRPVSDIILKLLAKNAEDRYQSARGLQADLQHCRAQLQATGQLETFELGRDDFTGRLQIPQKLYGRQAEIDQLVVAFDRVIQGSAELLLVAGYAGVGKTSLVHEVHKPITAKRGYFIEGKFDQYQRSIPYFAWGQAFTELVNQWQTESETELARWRGAVLDAVGQNGQVLIEIIPDLELVIGPQPEVPELGGVESQNRFNYLFQRFVRTVAAPDHPLVVFLDDLQWIDLASLNLLKTLLTDPDSGYFLVVGAYRDNEVDAAHSLMLGLKDLKEAGGTVNQLTLDNLAWADINQLLSDGTHTPIEQCLPLAQLVHAKTHGNAFFTHQLLHTLEADGLLTFDQESLCWSWDLAELQKLSVSDNVVDLMVNKFRRLPVATQEVLKIAACLGNQFELAMLNLMFEQSPETTQQALQAAYQEGLLVQVNEHGRFVHDRIQQAAYSLIPEPELAPLHRRIGRTLLRETPPQAREERLFDLVGHLNWGASLVETDAERIELAEMNLNAAQKALQATASEAASAYAQTAIEMLAENGWQAHYLLTLKLHQLAAEAAYLNLDYTQSQHYIATILNRAQSLIDQVPAHIIQIRIYTAQNLNEEAIETGLAVLDDLGITLLESEPAGVSVQAISELAPMTDPQVSAAVELVDILLVPAHNTRPELFSRLIYTALHLTLKFGLHPSSCTILITYAMLSWSEDIERAYQFGELALQLVEELDADRYMGQVKGFFEIYLSAWKSHYRTVERGLRNSIQIGIEAGDKTYAMASLVTASALNLFLRDRLDQAHENMTQDIRLVQASGEDFLLFYALIWTQFVANLSGRSHDPLCFEGPLFDEASDLPPAQAEGQYQITYYLHLLKLILHYHLGHFQAAFAYSENAEPFLPYLGSHLLIPLLPFYQSLAILQLSNGQGQPSKLVEKLEQNLQKLQLWAQHAPMNHRHKVDLILAERARLAGDVAAAMDFYEAAIAGASENAYIHEEALANELYARFWIERGKDRFAGQFMREAHALYDRWGAAAIVEHLQAQYPQWLKLDTLDIAPSHPETSLTKTLSHVDLRSILKASQAIAGEIELDRLLSHMMIVVMENAGAERGYLILEQKGAWFIEAAAEMGEAKPRVRQAIPIAESNLLSEGVIQYVARTRQTVVLGDASREGRFSQDACIQDRQVKSLLCAPLVNQGKTSAILYLENNLAADVFAPDRVALLEMLTGQMAAAVDNARLYRQLGDLLAARDRALSSAEAQIQSLFENSNLGIALTTLEGRVIAANQALLDITGYTEAEMGQRNITTLYRNPDQRRLLLQELGSKRSVQSFGIQARRKDGTDFFASLNVSLVTHDERDVLLTIVEDVTKKSKAEEALRTSQVLLQSALDALSANIAVLDKNGVIIAVNASWRAFAEANGLAWADYGLGRSYLEPLVAASAHSAVGADEAATGIQAILSGQRDSFSLDYACHSPREERWFTMRATCFDSSQGMRVVVSHEDITQRVQAEKQLEQAAAIAERDRIARELHDAVTQTLFSASSIAEATPHIWLKDPALAQQYMDNLTVMLRGALAEMRTLLLELRPDALREQTLDQLLQFLVEATQLRANAPILLVVNGKRPLPEDVTMAFHRIAQESLNNVVKHADATEVSITLDCDRNGVVLRVRDNGCGFDPSTIPAGHLGLSIMAERIETLGGTLLIDSKPGDGTQIVVSWSE
jgi:PAS domain S-box-containing protein